MAKRRLIMVLDEAPDEFKYGTQHICHKDGCPFFGSLRNKGICGALWNTTANAPQSRPGHSNMSLCRYYNTKDVHIFEVEGEATIAELMTAAEEFEENDN